MHSVQNIFFISGFRNKGNFKSSFDFLQGMKRQGCSLQTGLQLRKKDSGKMDHTPKYKNEKMIGGQRGTKQVHTRLISKKTNLTALYKKSIIDKQLRTPCYTLPHMARNSVAGCNTSLETENEGSKRYITGSCIQ